jgi:transcriptional regulator with XRE-family HTH domain
MSPPSSSARETGEYVRTKREQAGLTQSELAELLGSHQPAIARLEAGDTNVNMRTLERIAEALELEIEWAMVPREEALSTGVPGRMRPKSS